MRTKELLNKLFPNTYFYLKVKKYENNFNKVENICDFTREYYFHKFGVKLNLDNPINFYEKINYLKLFHNEVNAEKLIDKVLVKKHLDSLGYSKHIAREIASFSDYKTFSSSIKSIKTDNNDFVVKLNHTSGDVFFYNNSTWREKHGRKVSQRYVYACLRQKLKLNYYHYSLEKIYDRINPQILIEEFLPSLQNGGLDEYKFFLNHGEVKMINVVYGRQKDKQLKEAFTDSNLKILNAYQNQQLLSQEEIYRPDCFDKMIDFCKKTVSDRPLIRVDLMTDGKEFYFCEFTFYDCSGMNIFNPPESNKTIGDLFDIREIIASNNK